MENITHISLNTPSGVHSDLYCGEGVFEKFVVGNVDKEKGFLLTDSNVYALYGELIEKAFGEMPHYVLPAGEESKNYENLINILQAMISAGLHRNSCLYALGGGVVGDIGGLAASLYMRGISCVQIPTTLLAQVDSSVGGKTAVDVGKVKNIIGSFYQPQTVVADPLFFQTLPQREIRCGLGEIVKYGGLNESIFEELYHNKQNLFSLDYLSHIVPLCIRHKAGVVEADEKEKGLRKSLNMGHTTGHALELFYGNLSHGEFVLAGMYYEILFGESKGLCQREYTQKLKELILLALGGEPKFEGKEKCAYLAKMDKKNSSSNRIAMVVPTRLGEYSVVTTDFEEYENFLKNA